MGQRPFQAEYKKRKMKMEVFRTAKVFVQNRFTGFLVRARIEAVGEKSIQTI